jgi:putative transposase
MGLPK